MTRPRSPLMALLALLVGCARMPPKTYSIDSEFSATEAEVIRSAIDSWCDAAEWCPAEVPWSDDAHFELVDSIADASDDPACNGPSGCRVGGWNVGDGSVLIARDRPRPQDLGLLWTIIAHEAGHFCAEHTETGLMSAYMAPDSGQMAVDETAVEAWRAGCP